ncbi:MAG TPA: c-type cytochrome [Planctomycetaceae bacterium]|nr:c-type cytochrome [Planctomycetaceae bacterium]
MPADETFWRPLRRMHVVFAVSCVALLAVTIWMLGEDHKAEWHAHADTVDRIQALKFERQLAQENAKSDRERIERIFASIEDLREPTLADELREQFRTYEDDASYVDKVQRLIDWVAEHKTDQQRISDLESEIADLARREDLLARAVRLERAERDKARADFDLSVARGDGASAQERFKSIAEREQRDVDRAELEHEQVLAQLDALKAELAQATKVRDTLHAALDKELAEARRIDEARQKVAPDDLLSRGKRKVMQWPIIDGFNSPHKIDQIWLPDLKQRLGMAHTQRYDRCRTCHRLIGEVEAGNVPAFPHGHPTSDDPADWVAAGAFPHPYATHPNPDLYLTASSPHPAEEFGCTGCHQGQGSGTSFSNASHAPNDPHEQHVWHHEYGYHSNHFWEYPMLPERFRESACLRCHHNVVELGVHPKFGASAPQAYRGYQLVSKYGCFGCHEIHGFEAGRSIGPDLRLEPETEQERRELADDPAARPGKMRKVGPSLRHIASKTTPEWVQFWTEEPQRFRPTTRMPQFFKLANQVNWESHATHAKLASGSELDLVADADPVAARFQPVEIAGVAQYLFDKSQPMPPAAPEHDVSALAGHSPDAANGRQLFSLRGCLACHSHKDFPQSTADFGPDLSDVHAKLPHPAGADPAGSLGFQWLYGWVLEPERYHPRTTMPNLYLAPQEAADIAAWLLQGESPEYNDLADAINDQDLNDLVRLYLQKSQTVAQVDQALAADPSAARAGQFDLRGSADIRGDEIELVYPGEVARVLSNTELQVQFDGRQAEQLGPAPELIFASGPGANLAVRVASFQAGSESGSGTRVLDQPLRVTPEPGDRFVVSGTITRDMKLNYVGRRTISQYGCFGCHDIPGFETARPIGTALQDWGRKDQSLLALEHIEEFLHHHGEPDGSSTINRAVAALKRAQAGGVASGEFTSPEQAERELSTAYFVDAISHHGRAGFLWQKLREPRSYDYKKIELKGYEERLRMPRFTFSPDPHENEQAIEAVATFILGLVAEPPADKYLYQPTGPAADRLEGERLLEKFNCIGCHVIDLPKVRYGIPPEMAGVHRGLADLVGMTRQELIDWFLENKRDILAAHADRKKVDEAIAVSEHVQLVLENITDILDPVDLKSLAEAAGAEGGAESLSQLFPFLDADELATLRERLPEWSSATDARSRLPDPVPEDQLPEQTRIETEIANARRAVSTVILANGARKWLVELARLADRDRDGQALSAWFGDNREVLIAGRLQPSEYPDGLRLLLDLRPPRTADTDQQFLTAADFGRWLVLFSESEPNLTAAAQDQDAQARHEARRLIRQRDGLRQAGVSMGRVRRLGAKLVEAGVDLDALLFPEPGAEEDPEQLALKQELISLYTRYEQPLTSVLGQPVVDFHGLLFQGKNPQLLDYEQTFSYHLWETLDVGGRILLPGGLPVPMLRIIEESPGRGGHFAHWLVGQLIAQQGGKAAGDRGKAWQMAPPPLYQEGLKVQTPWLYRFLKNPHVLRHEAVLRMPQFNLDDDEALALANYFAAADGAVYPYQAVPQREPGYLAHMKRELARLNDQPEPDYIQEGWDVLNGNLCIKCHSVGTLQFAGANDPTAIRGPDLGAAYDRLRPDWLQLWLMKPPWITPYTSMPVNFPRDQVMYPHLFDGDGQWQITGIRDALLNYRDRMEQIAKESQPPPTSSATAGGDGGPPAAGQAPGGRPQ